MRSRAKHNATPSPVVPARPGGREAGRPPRPSDRRFVSVAGRRRRECGAADDFGFKAIEKPVHVHDLHATILYLMGIDHTKLTYQYSGRDFRLTDVSGTVLHEIIA